MSFYDLLWYLRDISGRLHRDVGMLTLLMFSRTGGFSGLTFPGHF
jgi:hypothetical protein